MFEKLLVVANLAYGVDFVDEVNFLVILLVVIKFVCIFVWWLILCISHINRHIGVRLDLDMTLKNCI